MDLAVTPHGADGPVVVTIAGEVDVYTAPLLREALDREIAAGHVRLVVDLERVDFIDSTGLGVLVGRLKSVRNGSGWLRIVCTKERVLKVFHLTGLDKVFRIVDTVEAATAPPPAS